MAKNLVKEVQEKNAAAAQDGTDKKEETKSEITVITMEQAILNNLDVINSRLTALEVLIKKGFEQCGVKFD